MASSLGGNNLTLHGTSFSPELGANKVTVGGEVCKVLEASVDRLVPGDPAPCGRIRAAEEIM